MPHLPVTQRLLLAALLMWLTTASAEAPTRPPLRAPAGQCSVISEVNGEVGDKVTFTAFCVALKSKDPKCLAGEPPIHGKNDCHLDGGKADRYEWRDMLAKIISARDPCEDPNGIVNDSVTVIAEQVGGLLVSFSPTRCGHGVSSWRTSHTVIVKPAPVPDTGGPTTTTTTTSPPPVLPTPIISCDPTRFEEQTLACPAANQYGSYTQRRTNQCPSNTYGDWVIVSNSCVTCTANSTYIVASNTCRCNAGYYSDLIAKTCVSTCPTPTVGLSNGSCGCPSGAAYNGTSCVPVCTAGVSNSLIAVGSSISVTAFCTPDATSYTWYASGSPTDNPPPVTGTGRIATFNTIGTYQYQVAGTNADGTGQKSAPATVTVVSSLTPICNISPASASLTPGGSVTLTATCNPTATGYTWTVGGTGAPTISNTGGTLTFSNPGTYTYQVTGSNGQGTGAASNTVTITVAQPTPICTVAADATILVGESTSITASCSPAASSYTWSASPGAPAISGTGGTLAFNTAGTYTYQVTGSNTGGAGQASNTVTIVVQAKVTASISQSVATTIAGEALTTTWGSTNATSCALDYSRGGEPFMPFTSGLSGVTTTYPSYVGTIVVRNTCQGPGGPAVATYTHTVLQPPPVCTVTANPESVTAGGTSTITASCTNSPTSYTWTVSNGGPAISGTGGTLTFPTPGTYTYSVIGSNAAGAGAASNTVTVVVGVRYYYGVVPGGSDAFLPQLDIFCPGNTIGTRCRVGLLGFEDVCYEYGTLGYSDNSSIYGPGYWVITQDSLPGFQQALFPTDPAIINMYFGQPLPRGLPISAMLKPIDMSSVPIKCR